jgi:hypothetical protein
MEALPRGESLGEGGVVGEREEMWGRGRDGGALSASAEGAVEWLGEGGEVSGLGFSFVYILLDRNRAHMGFANS